MPQLTPSNTDPIAVLMFKVDNLGDRQGEMIATMRELTTAVGRLSVIEERQSTDRAAMTRAFDAISAIEKRVDVLEREQPMNKLTSGLVQKVVGWVLAAVVGAFMAGLLTKPAPTPSTAVTIQGSK